MVKRGHPCFAVRFSVYLPGIACLKNMHIMPFFMCEKCHRPNICAITNHRNETSCKTWLLRNGSKTPFQKERFQFICICYPQESSSSWRISTEGLRALSNASAASIIHKSTKEKAKLGVVIAATKRRNVETCSQLVLPQRRPSAFDG